MRITLRRTILIAARKTWYHPYQTPPKAHDEETARNGLPGRTARTPHALIFERTEKVFTSHKGVQRELGRLPKSEPRFDPDLRSFLARAYHLKDIADCETGPDAKVSAERARDAIQTARRFVECAAALLPPSDQVPRTSDLSEP
jgi:hypothetical protein